MPLQLVIDDDRHITIPLDALTEEAWALQFERAARQGAVHSLCERLATCFAAALAECLDADFRRPTEAQLKYAMAIARDLNVALPSEALRFRGAMTTFLTHFAETHKQKRRGHHHGSESG